MNSCVSGFEDSESDDNTDHIDRRGMFSKKHSPKKTSIQEANRHLIALHTRVAQLERLVKEQSLALIKKDEWIKAKLREVNAQKDMEISELNRRVQTAEHGANILSQHYKLQETIIADLDEKCAVLESIAKHKPALDALVDCLSKAEQLGINTTPPSPPAGANNESICNTDANRSTGITKDTTRAISALKLPASTEATRNGVLSSSSSEDEADIRSEMTAAGKNKKEKDLCV